MQKVELREVAEPRHDCSGVPVMLTDETMHERTEKVLAGMRRRSLDQLIVYCDVEHAGNFNYLVGYFTRFEEGLLIIDASGDMRLVLGNENLNKGGKARVPASGTLCIPQFSLPNQPDAVGKTVRNLLVEAGVRPATRVGVAGWKLFTASAESCESMLDIPAFIADALRSIVGAEGQLVNATDIFIGADGARTTVNANEVAHYEYGAALASDCMLDAMDALAEGVSELELGDKLVRFGQHTSVVTIAASGPRFVKGNMFPTVNTVKAGDTISLTVGYAGGLSSRAGYAVATESQLPEGQQDWIERVAAPYFGAYVRWLECIHVGMTGGELFDEVERVLPRANYGWSLNPGHLVAEEEWLCSPVYEGSTETLRSGMMFQIDIIPSVSGYGGVSAESTVLLANDELKMAIQTEYPELWERIEARRAYLIGELGIGLSDDVLPMCSTVAYLRPYLLNHGSAFVMAR